jgi:signal transduction histidine kinase
LALSSQLEEVAVAGDKERLPAVLERVSALINKSLIDDFSKYSETPLLKIESLISAWRGIMQIEFDVRAEYLQDPKRNVVIARTVEEVITNAFRRGKASKIHISGHQIDGNLELFFESDGVLSQPGESGLGSKWFDSISIRPWVIEESSKGVTFKILL